MNSKCFGKSHFKRKEKHVISNDKCLININLNFLILFFFFISLIFYWSSSCFFGSFPFEILKNFLSGRARKWFGMFLGVLEGEMKVDSFTNTLKSITSDLTMRLHWLERSQYQIKVSSNWFATHRNMAEVFLKILDANCYEDSWTYLEIEKK